MDENNSGIKWLILEVIITIIICMVFLMLYEKRNREESPRAIETEYVTEGD